MIEVPQQRGSLRTATLPEPAVRDLQAFLHRGHLEVYDVLPGAASGTRRLVVGEVRRSQPSYVVAVAVDEHGHDAVDAEVRAIADLAARLRPRMRATVPSPVGAIEVGRHRGAVLSAVPGTGRSTAPAPSDESTSDAVLAWLQLLWEDTRGRTAPTTIGAVACGVLDARFGGSLAAAPLMGRLADAQAALAGSTTSRTTSHGCLCPRHVRLIHGEVVGVDDWGLARRDADPLADLGGWVVAVADRGLADVATGRSPRGKALREVLVRGLRYWGLPAARWRDVLLLAAAEAAVAGLARHDAVAFHLLGATSQALDPTKRQDGVSR